MHPNQIYSSRPESEMERSGCLLCIPDSSVRSTDSSSSSLILFVSVCCSRKTLIYSNNTEWGWCFGWTVNNGGESIDGLQRWLSFFACVEVFYRLDTRQGERDGWPVGVLMVLQRRRPYSSWWPGAAGNCESINCW